MFRIRRSLFDVCWLLYVACLVWCSLFAVGCWSSVGVYCVLLVISCHCCSLFAACFVCVFVVWGLLCCVCCVLFDVC